ncbi:NAD(P)/FAD-dependent oxidoreductase [Nocardia veterana]|uniref:FAD-dependent oxidoreductase n=1 Tax=Nocardia veterana TaxID=132249 RepID=A0A7X6M061_9NOCA|nr:FAD-dependent oxidoreductase [Nocardia veterana]NKY87782.1 FAD-dependent oxidoreductase [Nocardia veterana]
MTATSDVAVVGAGIVGLATAYALHRAGLSVTVYESGSPGGGQSAGQSRIFRHAHTDRRLVELAVAARRRWQEWEGEFGIELISGDGAVALGAGVADKLAILRDTPGVAARAIDPDEVASRLPLLAPYDGPAMLDETGGSIRTVAAIAALGARLRPALVADHVLTIRPAPGNSVEVRTGTTCSGHGAAVVCAGRGTAALARGSGLALPIQPSAHVRVSFRPRSAPPTTLATLQDSSGRFGETGIYAAAYPGNTHYGLGLSDTVATDGADAVDPAALAELAERAGAYVRRALPGLVPEPAGHVHCWVTRLPWGEDGVAAWQHENLTFVAGHNLFKLAPALGAVLADSVTTGRPAATLHPSRRLGDPDAA